ncbi:MAG: divalent-cation tolerance protein CutA [Candidatus Dormibacteraeota bacterium]|nr:divalent-cation tolerance protein CutA [Candidatus Dormibacteraeota bacterium]
MTHPAAGAVLLLVAAADRAEAERLGEALVEKRLAGSGSVIPLVHSFFHSDGRLQREHQALLLLKTTSELSAAAQAELRAIHSYDEPEILEVPVSGGSSQYLGWLAGQVRPGD